MAYRDYGDTVIDRAEGTGWASAAPAPSIIPALPGFLRPSPPLPRCPEIDCVRHLLPAAILSLAELRAAETGVGADRVLIAEGVISEEIYVTELAAWLGIPFEPLSLRSRNECPLPDDRMLEAPVTGMLPLQSGDDVNIVVAPRLVDSRRLVDLATSSTGGRWRIRLTTTTRLQHFVARHGVDAIAHRAIEGLREARPEFSASSGQRRHLTVVLVAAATAIAAVAARGDALTAVQLALGAVFLAWTGLRVFGLLSERLLRRRPRSFADGGLPVYTVIVALYREAAGVGDLVASLRRLNYPGIRAQTPQAI